jgi:ATP-dependent helicase/nuclease subunit A
MEADLLSRPNGVSALRRMNRFIEETTLPEPLCVHEFLDRLRDMDYKIEYSENGGEDSVKVLTMHSSKGLEYPIVILDNLSEKFRGVDHDEVFVEETYGLAPRAFNADTMVKRSTVLRRLHEIKEEESSLADGLNLYYVALTRAKYGLHMLFTSSTPMPDVKSYSAMPSASRTVTPFPLARATDG